MHYLFLGWADETTERAWTQAELEAVIAQHASFAARMRAEGKFVAGAGLSDSTHTKVVREDQSIVDGPFIELKEQIGGLYILDCADLDEALALAKQMPFGAGQIVEVRPAPH